ncbi:MAG TPA: sulfur transferase domain-containing protein [Gammaproteobacteria bacterium]
MNQIIRFLVLVAITSGLALAQDAELRNRMEPRENLTTSGQPTAESLRSLADSGYTTIIDLRRPEEDRGIDERAAVEGLGMSYISLPIDGANGVTFENADAINRILAEIDGPALVHCGSGNRAGAVLALAESLNGADDQAALQFGREAGLTSLEPVVAERLAEDERR